MPGARMEGNKLNDLAMTADKHVSGHPKISNGRKKRICIHRQTI
jgi:hypothetical protein